MQFRILHFEEMESTNTEAANKQYREGDVIVARSQTRGRGQRGNYWHGGAGKNLTFSTITEPVFLPAGEQFLLSEVVSLSVADTLASYGIEAAIKWPNDVYAGDRKIAGILIENDICGSNISRSIVGIGLNVNESDFPGHIPNPVSMASITGKKFDPSAVLSKFLGCLDVRYGELAQGGTAGISVDYHKCLYRNGVPGLFRRSSGEQFCGTIEAVKKSGPLLVRLADGTVEEFLFKEIEFVI